MIETRRLKNVVIFIQTILSFVLSRKIVKQGNFSKPLSHLNFFIRNIEQLNDNREYIAVCIVSFKNRHYMVQILICFYYFR